MPSLIKSTTKESGDLPVSSPLFCDLSRPLSSRLWLGPFIERPKTERLAVPMSRAAIIPGGTFRSWNNNFNYTPMRHRVLLAFQFRVEKCPHLTVNRAWCLGSVTDPHEETTTAKREAERACMLFMVVQSRMQRIGLPIDKASR